MQRTLAKLLNSLRSTSFRLLVFAGILLLIWGVLAPVGTLLWWVQQSSESLGLNRLENWLDDNWSDRTSDKLARISERTDSRQRALSKPQLLKINCYVVFLPGVGDFSANELTPGEEWFLQRLVEHHPRCVTVTDVFPYSAANEDLTGERLLNPLWRAASKAEGWFAMADVLIKIRNLWRFAISADDRYGPVYSRGIASAIIDRMHAAHPLPAQEQPLTVILMGTSGGVQVALGAADYLEDWLMVRPVVISMGGVFDGEKGFDAVQQVYHLWGDRDWVDNIGQILFASRWRWTVGSPFNRARRTGRYVALNSGPHAHDGDEGYFGMRPLQNRHSATEPDGGAIAPPSYVELTLQQVNQLPIWSRPNGSR